MTREAEVGRDAARLASMPASRPTRREVPSTTRVPRSRKRQGLASASPSVTVNLAAGPSAGPAVSPSGCSTPTIWGFSVPRMLGVDDPPGRPTTARSILTSWPVGDGHPEAGVDGVPRRRREPPALMWRGLILSKALEQNFLTDVRWGEMDYLLIDMAAGYGRRADGTGAHVCPKPRCWWSPHPGAQRTEGRDASRRHGSPVPT